jgi:ferredoxin
MLRIMCRQSVCVACGLCIEICGQQALSLAPVAVDRILAPDAPGRTLFERTRSEAAAVYAPVEDKMKTLLGVAVYRM